MTNRLSNLDRTLKLVHALSESIEGLTLDEMAEVLSVNRRTVERIRNVILIHFDLDESVDGRTKRFRIKDSPGRAYTRPSAAEVAALQAVVEAGRREGTVNTQALEKLLSKVKMAFDSSERRRLDNDLDLLTRLQRSRVAAGPAVIASPEDLTTIQSSILASHCVDFDYQTEWAEEPSWRRVVRPFKQNKPEDPAEVIGVFPGCRRGISSGTRTARQPFEGMGQIGVRVHAASPIEVPMRERIWAVREAMPWP